MVIHEFMEGKVDFFYHWLPPEDQIIEVIDGYVEIATEYVFLEGAAFA